MARRPAIAKRGKKTKRKAPAGRIRYFFYLLPFLLVLLVFGLGFLYNSSAISQDTFGGISTIALSFIFSAAALAYLALRRFSPREMLKELRFNTLCGKGRIIGVGILLFILVLILELGITVIQQVTGIQLPTNVDMVLGGLPIYVLLFSVFIAPINEELLFRGLLVPRLGIVASAILFALPHLLVYSSVSELIGALAFGLIAGYAFKKTNSIYPSIIAHILVNMLAIIPLLYH